jgi:3-dehydroquinate synthase
MNQASFTLKNKDTVCDVFAGKNLYDEVIIYLKKMNKAKYVIITDSKVEKLHGETLFAKCKEAGLNAFMISFPEGEKNKTRQTKANLEDKMFEQKCGRDAVIIALGGGVTGDMSGFVAGTYMRGISVVQIPTTTISIADSSYGGKTGLDVPAGKNLIGVFHQPVAVFMDTELLKTLDKRNYDSGLIEMVKHGMIKNKEFYDFFKENLEKILTREGEEYDKVMSKIVMDNIAIKREVVVEDQKESNLRKILNYGHTIGHAVEKLSNFDLLHGEAIAIGISVEAFLAYKNDLCSEECFLEQKNMIEKMGLLTKIPDSINTSDIVELMKLDKKARDGTPEFSLVSEIGKYFEENGVIAKRFSLEVLAKVIDEYKKFV